MGLRKKWIAPALAIVLATGTVAVAQDKPKPEITFSLAGDTFRANENVEMTGTITPATAPESVKIRVQKMRSDGTWRNYDRNFVDSRILDEDSTSFSFTHDPLPRGTYRARAEVSETDDHLAGKNRWKRYRVVRRRHR